MLCEVKCHRKERHVSSALVGMAGVFSFFVDDKRGAELTVDLYDTSFYASCWQFVIEDTLNDKYARIIR